MQRWEPRIAARFDKVAAVSEPDKHLLLSKNPKLDIEIVPNGVETEALRPLPLIGREKNIVIVGTMGYEPNADGVLYFHREIFPLIKEKVPGCTLSVVGKKPPVEICHLSNVSGISVQGDVGDVKPYYAKAMVSAVPLRSGGGTRLKILEAMALGTPVVSTSIGCEGLDVENGRNILIADDPPDFAQRVTDLMTDTGLWNQIAREGRALVEDKYDWRKISEHYRDMLHELVSGH